MGIFMVDGTAYTALSYGYFMLKKQYKESEGFTKDPKRLTTQEIEVFGLETLQERMMEDEMVYEVTEEGEIQQYYQEREKLIKSDQQIISSHPPDYSKMTNEQIKRRTEIIEKTFEIAFDETDEEEDDDDI